MRGIDQYIKNIVDEPDCREEVEWSNFWYDYAENETKKRVLLIGDSTVRMIRGTLSSRYGIAVDMLGSSAGMHDILFISQINAFFSSVKYSYDVVFIQLGHHSRKGKLGGGGNLVEEDYITFEADYS